MHVETDFATWLFIFLVASVVAVLPLSLGGGLGTREFVFVTGAEFFLLNQQTGLTASLIFFVLTVISSVGGAYFIFKDPLPGTKN